MGEQSTGYMEIGKFNTHPFVLLGMSLHPLTAEPFGAVPAGTIEDHDTKQLKTANGTALWYFALPATKLMHIAFSSKGLSHEAQKISRGDAYMSPSKNRI